MHSHVVPVILELESFETQAQILSSIRVGVLGVFPGQKNSSRPYASLPEHARVVHSLAVPVLLDLDLFESHGLLVSSIRSGVLGDFRAGLI